MKYQNIIDQLTLDEKISLISGRGMWHTKEISRLNIPPIMMCDGPHGLRKIADEEKNAIYDSVRATCFPTASMSACSWDEELLQDMGNAIAEEALQENVSVVLGPGVNIKRSPLCGRNFEYFSEDPFLAGKMAAGWIRGVETRGVGTSLKHFAVNNQEFMRLSISAEVDDRALREIYLKPFEIAVKEGKPSTVMCAYNKINGEYCASSKELLTDILREQWGFDGVVMSDWGAVDDRVKSVKAGMDLEMPDSKGYYDQQVKNAIENKTLDMQDLDLCVDRILNLVYKSNDKLINNYKYNPKCHADLAEKVALESAVLLKNNGLLPLAKNNKVLVIGSLAKHARYQGGGSSHISPYKVTSLLEGMQEIGALYDYVDGYSLQEDKNSQKLLTEALEVAQNYQKIALCIGLVDDYETEGMDRKHLELPSNQSKVIDAIKKLNKQVVLVYYGGSPARFDDAFACATLSMYLAGESGGSAGAKLLYGLNNPCGKLAETFPLDIKDTPCYDDFGKGFVNAVYGESIYVGYRYYDSAKVAVKYPFGHGLSYTKFGYSNLKLDKKYYKQGDKIALTFDLANTGEMDGKEIVQVYTRMQGSSVFRPYQELKSFKKIELSAGQKRQVEMILDTEDLRVYDTADKNFKLESGSYEIAVGASSRDIKLIESIEILGEQLRPSITDSWYNNPKHNNPKDFDKLRGYKVENNFVAPQKGSFTMENSLIEIAPNSFMARRIMAISGFFLRVSLKVPKTDTGYIMINEMFKTSPLKKLSSSSQGAFNQTMCEGLVLMLNGSFFKGLGKLLKGNRTRQPLKI